MINSLVIDLTMRETSRVRLDHGYRLGGKRCRLSSRINYTQRNLDYKSARWGLKVIERHCIASS